jgi:integrating conjugative element protein (TIGR03761 family)
MAQKTQDPGQGGGSEKVTAIRAAVDRPGALRGESWITIQTRQAQRLLVPARMDDPYAQWWLVKIEDALEGSARVIEDLRQQVEARLKGSPGFEATIAESLEPVRVPLKFANPYAYQAARLIIAFDDLMRAILTARHVGLMGREETEKTANLGGRAVRRALNSGLGYKFKMVFRNDIEESNAKAVEARELMGEVPQEILDRTVQAKHAPEPASPRRTESGGYFGFRSASTFKSLAQQATEKAKEGVTEEGTPPASPAGDVK